MPKGEVINHWGMRRAFGCFYLHLPKKGKKKTVLLFNIHANLEDLIMEPTVIHSFACFMTVYKLLWDYRSCVLLWTSHCPMYKYLKETFRRNSGLKKAMNSKTDCSLTQEGRCNQQWYNQTCNWEVFVYLQTLNTKSFSSRQECQKARISLQVNISETNIFMVIGISSMEAVCIIGRHVKDYYLNLTISCSSYHFPGPWF